MRLKRLATLVTDAQYDGPRPLIALEHVEPGTGRLTGEEVPSDPPSEAGIAAVEPGDVLFGKLRPYLSKSWVADRPVLASTELLCLRPAPDIDSRWLGYLLASGPLIDWAVATSDGTKMPRTSWEKLGEFRLDVPSPNTQRTVADYLDRETARIDALISAKRRMVALLMEKRQMVVTRAVTTGCDPGVDLIDSGLSWLRDIPSHWLLSKFTRSVLIAEGQVDPGIAPYSAMVLVAPNHVESGTGTLLSSETASEQGAISGKYLCRPGDVIYSKIRPALRKAIVASQECLCSADMYPLRVRGDLDAQYLLYFILSEPFSTWAVLESERVAMPKINRESLAELRLPLPPLEEQKRIVAQIANETRGLDEMRSATEGSILLLNERRKALVTGATIGQIVVPATA